MAITLDVKAFSQRKVSLDYPNIMLGSVDVSSAIVIEILEPGDIPVIGEHNGERRILRRISASAYNVEKLLRIHPTIIYNLSESERVEIKSVTDYLGVIEWTY